MSFIRDVALALFYCDALFSGTVVVFVGAAVLGLSKEP
jgi:hypothetical protein